ncbi:MAG: NAD-dependent malic enzyme [Flavobacteriales bacterium]|nr:NAD-dependent malic enzyme [Flavobacteriales bacterium]
MKKHGFDILRDKHLYRSLAFTHTERELLGLRGLLPWPVLDQAQLVERVMMDLRKQEDDLDRYIMLSALQERNEHVYYRTILDHIEELLPVIYTPTVGEACKEYSHISREPKGFFITPDDRGEIGRILGNWPEKDVHVIVVTDGQRILGLGDLGVNGMGIPIGKLALYTACAGIPPQHCLPVMLDVGTNDPALLADPLYLGYPHKRLTGDAYFSLVEEFVLAVQERFPNELIQFEDFLTPNAYALLNTYRERVLCFNDDIQGTAAVALAGVLASGRITGRAFKDTRILFLGAGSAATGIADLMANALMAEGLSHDEAVKHLWFVDVNGLVVQGRTDLQPHNLPYAHAHAQVPFLEAIDAIRPHVLIGATGAPGTFTQPVIERMSALNERPVIFALSNPTSKAECTAEQAYTWSKGRAVFCSGSPFGEYTLNGRTYRTGQGNNAYVFPGIGLGVVAAQASRIPEAFFLTAARTVAAMVGDTDLAEGALYPRLRDIRAVSLAIAVNIAEQAHALGLARKPRAADIEADIRAYRYEP